MATKTPNECPVSGAVAAEQGFVPVGICRSTLD